MNICVPNSLPSYHHSSLGKSKTIAELLVVWHVVVNILVANLLNILLDLSNFYLEVLICEVMLQATLHCMACHLRLSKLIYVHVI